MRERKTDYGTVILHWLFVLALAVALVTGLRIATEEPGHDWINLFDTVLPRNVWVLHMQAAVVIVTLAVAYVVYLLRSGLSARVRLDGVRLRGLFGPGQVRLRSLNVVLCWAFFATMIALIVSGGALYFGLLNGYEAASLHWYATLAVPAFVGLHLMVHALLGGGSQILRIFRAAPLVPPPPPLDAVELLTLLAEQSARLQPEPPHHEPPRRQEAVRKDPVRKDPVRQEPMRQEPVRQEPVRQEPVRQEAVAPEARLQPEHPAESEWREHPLRRRPRRATLQANPLAVAAAVAITSASIAVVTDRLSVDGLTVHRIAVADAPLLDGDTSDRVWRNIQPHVVVTGHGDNFDGRGDTRIEIRAVHDGSWAYFLFTWSDPTRSLKHLPLVKKADGWHLLHNGAEHGAERDYNEDKFSVLLTRLDVTLPGDRTFHASPHPLADFPATMTGRGLHYTNGNVGAVDVWQWRATSGGPTGWIDDGHFGPPVTPTPEQASGRTPYKGGYALDPGRSNYADNFVVVGEEEARVVRPRRLPRDVSAMTAGLGEIDLDPDHGESTGSRWYLIEADSVPYSEQDDARIPPGTVVPGVILSGEVTGDRADVRCAARWASGHWALEVARRIDTGSPFDVAIQSGVFMRVAAFDHTQIGHTRHVRPIRLEVE